VCEFKIEQSTANINRRNRSSCVPGVGMFFFLEHYTSNKEPMLHIT